MLNVVMYMRLNGEIVIRWPKGVMPDQETIDRLYQAISAQKSKK